MRKRRERVEKWRQEQKSGGLKKTETEDGGEDADDEEKPRKVWSLEDDDDDDEGGRSSYANIPHAWLSGTSDLLDLFCWEVVNCLWITFECNFGFEKKQYSAACQLRPQPFGIFGEGKMIVVT